MRRDEILITDMLRFARQAASAGGRATVEQLEHDVHLQATVLWPLTLLGEAASKVSTDYRNAHAHIPWRRIVGLRNTLIHDYSGMDFIAVVDVLQVHLPTLIVALEAFGLDPATE